MSRHEQRAGCVTDGGNRAHAWGVTDHVLRPFLRGHNEEMKFPGSRIVDKEKHIEMHVHHSVKDLVKPSISFVLLQGSGLAAGAFVSSTKLDTTSCSFRQGGSYS